jgi:hypothetical protein
LLFPSYSRSDLIFAFFIPAEALLFLGQRNPPARFARRTFCFPFVRINVLKRILRQFENFYGDVWKKILFCPKFFMKYKARKKGGRNASFPFPQKAESRFVFLTRALKNPGRQSVLSLLT